MASTTDIIGKSLQGHIGKQLVFKQYGNKTVVSKYPDMSTIEPSSLQLQKRSRFTEAVAFAKAVNRDAEQRATYAEKAKPGQTVYHCALQAFLKGEV